MQEWPSRFFSCPCQVQPHLVRQSAIDQDSTLGASRRTRASQNSVNHSSVDEKCRVVISQFVEAVTARQAAATRQNGVSRECALRIIDAEIETLNDRIGEQSCGQ